MGNRVAVISWLKCLIIRYALDISISLHRVYKSQHVFEKTVIGDILESIGSVTIDNCSKYYIYSTYMIFWIAKCGKNHWLPGIQERGKDWVGDAHSIVWIATFIYMILLWQKYAFVKIYRIDSELIHIWNLKTNHLEVPGSPRGNTDYDKKKHTHIINIWNNLTGGECRSKAWPKHLKMSVVCKTKNKDLS